MVLLEVDGQQADPALPVVGHGVGLGLDGAWVQVARVHVKHVLPAAGVVVHLHVELLLALVDQDVGPVHVSVQGGHQRNVRLGWGGLHLGLQFAIDHWVSQLKLVNTIVHLMSY